MVCFGGPHDVNSTLWLAHKPPKMTTPFFWVVVVAVLWWGCSDANGLVLVALWFWWSCFFKGF